VGGGTVLRELYENKKLSLSILPTITTKEQTSSAHFFVLFYVSIPTPFHCMTAMCNVGDQQAM
jgi:hypothetical protein